MKRANGTGSAYKLPGRRRKPWAARVTVGWDENGKQVYRPIGTYKTRAEAETALALQAVMPSSEYANITLKELFEMYKMTRRYEKLDKSTKDNYNSSFNLYMTEYHNRKFADLRPNHFQKMVDKAYFKGRGSSVMKKIIITASMLSSFAIAHDIIRQSYVVQIVIPETTISKIEKPIFYLNEIETLFNNDNDKIVRIVLILIYTGFRPNELLGLEKANVDLKNRVFTGGSKTDAGTDRVVPIHWRIYQYVVDFYNESEQYLIEWNKAVGSSIMRVRYQINTFRKKYYKMLERLGIERRDLYKTRHTFFTMLDEHCQDKKAMADIGGHTDPNFSEKIYVHTDLERLHKAISTIP